MRSSRTRRVSPVSVASGAWTGGGSGPASRSPKYLGRQRQRAIRVDVAGERQRRVARPVVGPKKRADIVQARGFQVLRGADRHPVVRVRGWIQGRHERHPCKPIRPVLIVLTPFVQDDIALVLELGIGQGRQEVAHAIGLHPQRDLQSVRRHDLPVVGPIGVGRSIEDAADFLQRSEVSRHRGARTPRTSSVRRDARIRCGPAARSSSRRGTTR